jgi:hypothetical protein
VADLERSFTYTNYNLNVASVLRDWEASLEAIRIALKHNGDGFTYNCMNNLNIPCTLNWRQDAKKMIVLITDEDSDLPHNL